MILETKRICKKMESIQTFYTQTLATLKLEDFKLYAISQKNKTISSIKALEEEILAMVK
jgi:hypothetical protein